MKKKFFIIFIILVLSCNLCVFADDEVEEYENVLEQSEQEEIEETASELAEPTINSRKYVIYDRLSGTTIYGKDENKQAAMASTTKIMTAIVVVENCDLSNTVTIDQKSASIGGSRLGLKTGDKITVNDLLYGLMLRSGNDAALALAIYIAGSVDEFASLMNQKAKEIGLSNTHFVTPHGLDNENHYTTAYELAKMTDYALNNETISNIVKTKYKTISINGVSTQITNTNELLGNVDGVYGVKTGFTNNAGRCLVTSVKRGDLDFIVVVLGADTRKDRANDTVKLIEYAMQKYQVVDVAEIVNTQFEMWKQINQNRIVINKAANSLELEMEDLEITQIATDEEVSVQIKSITYLESPVERGTRIGTLVVKLGETLLEEVPIVASKTVEKRSIVDYFSIIAKIYTGKISIIAN